MSLSAPLIIAMAVGTYGLRLLGLVLSQRGLPASVERALPALPAALLASLVVANGFTTDDGRLIVDERVFGMAAAAWLAASGKSLGVVVVGGVAVTAVIRLGLSFAGG